MNKFFIGMNAVGVIEAEHPVFSASHIAAQVIQFLLVCRDRIVSAQILQLLGHEIAAGQLPVTENILTDIPHIAEAVPARRVQSLPVEFPDPVHSALEDRDGQVFVLKAREHLELTAVGVLHDSPDPVLRN